METEPTAFETLDKEIAQRVFDKLDLGKVETITTFEHGMVNEVFCINDAYVLKINVSHDTMRKLEKEALVYNALRTSSVPVPQLYTSDESREIIPYPYIIIEKLPGRDLVSIWEHLSEEERQETIFEYGKLLGNIHSMTISESIPETTPWTDLKEGISLRIETIAKALRQTNVLPAETVAKIEEFYKNSELFEMEAVPSLYHGNYVFGNVIADGKMISGVIDWEWADLAYYEEELATVLYRGLPVGDYKERFIAGYKESHAISEEFESRYWAYVLLYYLKVLPEVPKWDHRLDKQKEYFDETEKLIAKVLS